MYIKKLEDCLKIFRELGFALQENISEYRIAVFTKGELSVAARENITEEDSGHPIILSFSFINDEYEVYSCNIGSEADILDALRDAKFSVKQALKRDLKSAFPSKSLLHDLLFNYAAKK